MQKFSNATVSDVTTCNDSSTFVTSGCLSRQDLPAPVSTLSVAVHELDDIAHIPKNCLEGIWSKATELLKTNSAIVTAPGMDGAKFVKSYSGHRPHLVSENKGGSFSCDEHCPNWSALHICSHTVAVANACGRLANFIAWFKKNKRAPSISRFAQATMPRGRGRKGNRLPRKRKSNVATENILENSTVARSSSPVPPTHAMPLVTQTNIQLQSGSQTNVQVPSTAPQYPALPSSWLPSQPYPFSAFTPFQPRDYNPFTRCKIAGNVSVCAGCRNRYPKKPNPPDNLCIQHKEWREFTTPGSDSPQARFGNTYYHFNPGCVWLRCPEFIPSSLQIPQELFEQLEPTHKLRLAQEFQLHY